MELARELGSWSKREYCHEVNDEDLRADVRENATTTLTRSPSRAVPTNTGAPNHSKASATTTSNPSPKKNATKRPSGEALLPRRGERSHAPLRARRRRPSRRPQDHRDPPHLVRGGLPARPSRIGRVHPRRDPVAGHRDPRHQARRENCGRRAQPRAANASCSTTTSPLLHR